MRLKNLYARDEAIKAMLYERDQCENGLISYDEYSARVLYILMITEEDVQND